MRSLGALAGFVVFWILAFIVCWISEIVGPDATVKLIFVLAGLLFIGGPILVFIGIVYVIYKCLTDSKR